MTDHFIWHRVEDLLPPAEPLPPSVRLRLHDPDNCLPVSEHHRAVIMQLVNQYGRPRVRDAMESLGYLPLVSVRPSQRALAIDMLRRRLEGQS